MNSRDTIHAEGAERAALADIHVAASSELRDRLGLELTEIGGTLVSIARSQLSLSRAVSALA